MRDNVVVVSIGRNVGDVPMSDDRWVLFRDQVGAAVHVCATTVHVDQALSQGSWQGIPEDAATWVAEVPTWGAIDNLRRRLGALARHWSQDAIALTIGDTELIEPS